jgi:hypothetical protein
MKQIISFILIFFSFLFLMEDVQAQCQNVKTGTIQASNPDFAGEIHYRRCDKLVSVWFENIERTGYSGYNPAGDVISTGLPGAMLPNQKGDRTFVAWITGVPPNVAVSSTPVTVIITQSGDMRLGSLAMSIGMKLSGSVTFAKN